MQSVYNLNLSVNAASPIKTGYTFKQGDKGIDLKMNIVDLDTTLTTAHIVFKRSNGSSVEGTGLTKSGSVYTYTVQGTEFEVPGIVEADLKFYNGDSQRVSTASFLFLVQSDTLNGLANYPASSYSDTIEQLVEDVQVYATQATTAATSANGSALVSEGYAIGKQNGTPVGSSSPYYENNSKYYSDAAQTLVSALLTNFGVDVAGTQLVFGATFLESFNVAVVGTQLQISNL